ncbi:helix-turn-helix domain-containing protein [Chromobacterium haemolyticum]|uniref:helix-turn-helix domain-containing protein n=1 Tax=Chromobacterium haemolyticum TaxID=394935 RepID=UPI0009DA3346|nr:helix-turn-helix domain-containing protein [Chromobacterium haemolyticum]OQS32107.1 hypothetical protein B0T39_23030 [Chromobacterium haemolyticum]
MGQLSIIDVLKNHPTPLSMQALADAMGIERTEARRQLRELAEAGSISQVTVGKQTLFQPKNHIYLKIEPEAKTSIPEEEPTTSPSLEQKLESQIADLNQQLAIAEKDRDEQAGIAKEALQLCQEQFNRLGQMEGTASILGYSSSAGIPLFEWLESKLPALAYELAFLQDL